MMDVTSFWMESMEEQETLTADQARQQLEAELSGLRQELADVRKELAAKTVQLSKRQETDKAAAEQWAEQHAAELAAALLAPKEQRIAALEQALSQVEVSLSQKAEELEEARRLYLSQKRALKDALSAAAERDAAEVAADESRLEAATAAAEEEVERLAQELSQLKTRSLLELQAKDAELAQLQQQLVQHEEDKLVAVAAAKAGAAAAAEEKLAEVAAAHQARVADLQAEVQRLRSSAQSYLRDEQEDMADQLAEANKEKVQLQREFDAFKDLTAQTNRQHREEQGRLLEENASLKARIAAEAARVALGVLPGAGVGRPGPKTFSAVGESEGVGGFVDAWLQKLERQRRGLLPVLVIASLVLLVLLIAVVRAAASSRGDERGVVCFLSKLGVQIGGGCSSSSAGSSSSKQAVKQALGELVEHTPRVKDIEPSIPSGSGSTPKSDGIAAAAAGAGRRRHLTARRVQWVSGAAAKAGRMRAMQGWE